MGIFLLLLKAAGVTLVFVVLLYLYFIAPRWIHRPDKKVFYQYFYAHRGLYDNASEAPENSLPAFLRAVEAGYGIELDIQLTKDGIPVVFHDENMKRMCGREGAIGDFTCEELQNFHIGCSKEHIPTLEDVLKLVDGSVPLIVELKTESLDLKLCSAADRILSGYRGSYCIESFNPLALLWYRCNHKQVIRGQLSTAFLRKKEYHGFLYFLLQNLLLNFLGRPDFIAYEKMYTNVLSYRICCKRMGAVPVAWTIQSPQEFEKARKEFDWYIFEGFQIKNSVG